MSLLKRKNVVVALLASLCLRLALVAYGEWQDATMVVKYTDIDYQVYTDASRFITEGKSPYERATYRYTPLLALILTPNIYLWKGFGKILFVLCDLVVGYLMLRLLQMRGVVTRLCLPPMSVAWLFNPLVWTISTRGNCDVLIAALILSILYCLLERRVYTAAVLFGIAVHFRIYPIVYGPAFIFFLGPNYDEQGPEGKVFHLSAVSKRIQSKGTPRKAVALLGEEVLDQHKKVKPKAVRVLGKEVLYSAIPSYSYALQGHGSCDYVKKFPSRRRALFFVVSALTFLTITAACYLWCGKKFIDETYFYHVTRKDNRHNFSVYFYQLYLTFDSESAVAVGVLTFFPQMMLMAKFAWQFALDLPFCLYLQTVTFVAFNKVCTAQYFIWYVCLLPLILPASSLRMKWTGVKLVAAWFLTEVHWLYWAYRLEFLGENVFLQLWVAGLMFFGVNMSILYKIMSAHEFTVTVREGRVTKIRQPVKDS